MNLLNPRVFGLAMGLAYADAMGLMAWLSAALRKGQGLIRGLGTVLPGYEPTFLGGLIGAAYGFVLGFSFGWGIARIYNALSHNGRVFEISAGPIGRIRVQRPGTAS